MRPLLKYAFVALLFLFCFSTVLAPAYAEEEEPGIYEILAGVARVSVADNEVVLYTLYGEVSLVVTEQSRFYREYDNPRITFSQFAREFVYRSAFDTTAWIAFTVYDNMYAEEHEYILVSAIFASSD